MFEYVWGPLINRYTANPLVVSTVTLVYSVVVFALSEPVPEMGDGTLTLAFAELRQVKILLHNEKTSCPPL